MEFTTIANAKKETKLSYLGNINSSAKLMKNKKVSHQYTYIMYLAPANTSGYNVCSHSTPECRMGCLAESGRAGMEVTAGGTRIKNARINKVKLFFEHQEYFMAWMIAEIKHYQAKAKKDGFYFSARLNGTSDIDWSKVLYNGKNIFEIFPDVQFYDYTKKASKFYFMPENYHLTFSYTGRNWDACKVILEAGHNVAMVFNVKKEQELPMFYKGIPVINGDLTDYRIADAKGIIVGLKFKHIANKEAERNVLNSVFVIQPDDVNCEYANVQKMSA